MVIVAVVVSRLKTMDLQLVRFC